MFTVRADQDGNLVLDTVSPAFVVMIQLALAALNDEDERVRARLLPDVYADDAHRAEWARYVSPDLEHLFASRQEIVRKDLECLRLSGRPLRGELVIPASHVSAWESALVGASHALFARYELTSSQLDQAEQDDEDDEDYDEEDFDSDVEDDLDEDDPEVAAADAAMIAELRSLLDEAASNPEIAKRHAERQWAIARIRVQQHIYWSFRSARAARERNEPESDSTS